MLAVVFILAKRCALFSKLQLRLESISLKQHLISHVRIYVKSFLITSRAIGINQFRCLNYEKVGNKMDMSNTVMLSF